MMGKTIKEAYNEEKLVLIELRIYDRLIEIRHIEHARGIVGDNKAAYFIDFLIAELSQNGYVGGCVDKIAYTCHIGMRHKKDFAVVACHCSCQIFII